MILTALSSYDQVWDPAKAEAAGYLDFVHRTATHNKKEAGMLLFNKRGYNVSGFCDDLAEDDTLDGSDWSHEEKVSFHKLIVAHHKDFGRVAKSMGKSRNNCLAYYYGKYKTPADYVELKRVMIRFKRRKVALARGEIVCTSCAYGGGDLLNCVTCKNYYHAKCVTSPPSSVNGAKWYCDECVAKRRRPVTRSSIGKRKLNRNSKGNEKKRSAVAQSSSFHVGRRFSRRLQAPLELCLMV